MEIMWQMLQVAMVQLMVMRVSRIDLVSQVEAVCQIGSGVSVVRTQEARSRSARVWEMELRGHALEALEKSQGPNCGGEKLESGPVEGLMEMLENTLR